MQISVALSLLSIFAGSIHAQDAGSILSELTPYVTQISSIIQAEATPIISELSELIQQYAPTGLVGDLPAVLSTNIPAIDSALLELVTAAIPSGSLPTDIAAEVPAFISQGVVEAVSEIDAVLTELPSTLSDAALPTLIASYIPVIGSELQDAATSLLPVLSSLLASPGAGNSTGTGSASGATVTPPSGASTTVASPSATASHSSGAVVKRMAWGMEVAAVVGFAAVVAAL